MKGWVDLGALTTPRPGIEPTTAWLKVDAQTRCSIPGSTLYPVSLAPSLAVLFLANKSLRPFCAPLNFCIPLRSLALPLSHRAVQKLELLRHKVKRFVLLLCKLAYMFVDRTESFHVTAGERCSSPGRDGSLPVLYPRRPSADHIMDEGWKTFTCVWQVENKDHNTLFRSLTSRRLRLKTSFKAVQNLFFCTLCASLENVPFAVLCNSLKLSK